MSPVAPTTSLQVAWAHLQPGTSVTIVKIAPKGEEVTRYPGEIIRPLSDAGWVTARATWTHREADIDGVRFRPGDTIDEHFSPTAWFNAFEVFHGAAGSQGWYINVTYPTRLAGNRGQLELHWHDLYLDVVLRPNGEITIRDEDELAEAGLADRDPALLATIVATRDEIVQRIKRAAAPFDQS